MIRRYLKPLLAAAAVAGLSAAGYFTRDRWVPLFHKVKSNDPVRAGPDDSPSPAAKVIVSDQAQQNLRLSSKRVKVEVFRKAIAVPGMVVDRPGMSDRGVVAPMTAVVTDIHHVQGDAVRPGDVLFTLKLLSESLHTTQTDLFKTAQEITVTRDKLEQAEKLAAIGSESQITVREIKGQLRRLAAAETAYRQELLNRGLSPKDIGGVTGGTFVSQIPVVAPPRPAGQKPLTAAVVAEAPRIAGAAPPPAFELQELKVELGQQVQAGQTLCLLANHQSLAIEGRAFGDETPLLERSVREGWPVEVDFDEAPSAGWRPQDQSFHIRFIANTIDPVNRTFTFQMPLENQSRMIERGGRTVMLWRYRPGQRCRLLVRVGEIPNVFVVPSDAVVRDGPEAYVFTQNVNTFERRGVHVLWQDRHRVVIANDGSLPTFVKDGETWTISAIAQSAASQLNRMVKAGSNVVPKGYHVHADGSLHKNEDENK